MQEQNVHPDKSVLSKDSDFYRPEDTRTTREKLKSMNWKDKIIFIAQYYGLKIAAIILCVVFVVYLILHFIFEKDTVLNIMAVNAQNITTISAAADEKSFYDEFLTQNGINPEDVDVSVDSTLNVVADDTNSTSMANIQAIQVQLMAGTDDVMFADEEFMASVGEMEYLADLNDYLSKELMEKYADDIVYATGLDSGEERAIGIRLTDNAWIEKSGWFENVKGPVVGICAGVQNKELSQQFVLYILGEQQ